MSDRRKVTSGRLKGAEFDVEGPVLDVCGSNCLVTLALSQGNFAALNAIRLDGYTVNDGPFYYGKIGGMGYIIAEQDFAPQPPDSIGE